MAKVVVGLNACVFVAAKADLRGCNVRFFQNDSVFVCQLLAVSFSLVLAFYDRKKNFKNIAVGVLYVLDIFAVSTVLNRLLLALFTVWSGVAGIHFQIAWLLTIVVYLLLFDDWTNVAYAAINVKSTLSAETFTSEGGTKLPYRFYKPDGYSETNSYKLLLLLHGKDERGADNEAQVSRRDAMPFVQKILADKQLKKQYFIVVPQCPTTDVWANVVADCSYAYNADEQTAAQNL